MGKRTKWIGVAVSVTMLDAVVVTYYGGVVWKTFVVVIWSKLLLLLLASVWGTTLLRIWVHACSELRGGIRERPVAVALPVDRLSMELVEEIDV